MDNFRHNVTNAYFLFVFQNNLMQKIEMQQIGHGWSMVWYFVNKLAEVKSLSDLKDVRLY